VCRGNPWLRPVYYADDQVRGVAPLVVKPKDAQPVSVNSDFNGSRPVTSAATPNGMRFRCSLRIVVASGDGEKVSKDIALVQLSGEGSALWEPATKELEDAGGSYSIKLIEPPPRRLPNLLGTALCLQSQSARKQSL
jgi:hypothetical protein